MPTQLTVAIVIRLTDPVTRKRTWFTASGRKSDPQGPYYLRYWNGSPRYIRTADAYDQACIEKIRLERKLNAARLGAVVVDNVAPKVSSHRLDETIAVYLADQARPDADGNFKSQKSLHSKKSELGKFVEFSGLSFVEEITREVLIGYRDHLNREGYERDTVHNKLLVVVSFLKHNGAVPYTKLLDQKDWPTKKQTVPDPYTDDEINRFLAAGSEEEHLLIRALLGTGMREQEFCVAEREDIDPVVKGIHVRDSKPQYNWRAKNKNAKRLIYLGDDLLADLLKRGPGLLFPNGHGHVRTHLLRDVIEPLAMRAKITPTTEKKSTHPDAVKNDWIHRFRDTWFTDRLEKATDIKDQLSILRQGGHGDASTLQCYMAQREANDPRTRAGANHSDRFARRPAPARVVAMRRAKHAAQG